MPDPIVRTFDPHAHYTPLLEGPPGSVAMRAGHVVLAPGASVGLHTTGDGEEALIVLEGEGRLAITGGPSLSLAAGTFAYNPPQAEHDVTNTGTGPLRYVYVVTRIP